MARSTLNQPHAVLSVSARDYEIASEEEILAFLERCPDVAALLPEIRRNIRKFFGDESVRLEMFHDPEWPEEGSKLIVNIETRHRSGEALDRLHQFRREWWFGQLEATRAPILVSFEHVPPV